MPKGKNYPKHTHFIKGKKVLVTLKTGEKLVDIFLNRYRTKIELQEAGMVDLKDVKFIARYYSKNHKQIQDR